MGTYHNQWATNWIHPLLDIRSMGYKEQTLFTNIFKCVSIFRPDILIRLEKNETLFGRIRIKSGRLSIGND